MSKNINIEIKGLTSDVLEARATEARSNVSKLKFDHAVRGLQNPLEISSAKKEVARLKTEIRAREVASMAPAEVASRSKIRFRRRSK
jgi:large subunit ribosomal protein L29